MNTRTGEIGPLEEFKKKLSKEEFDKFVVPVDWNVLSAKMQAEIEETGHSFVGRYSKCPCGSGKRFGQCCMKKDRLE